MSLRILANHESKEESFGQLTWWHDGIYLHRMDGPAMIYETGGMQWWIHGDRIDVSSNEEFLRFVKLKAFW